MPATPPARRTPNHAVRDDGIAATIASRPKLPLVPFVAPPTMMSSSSSSCARLVFVGTHRGLVGLGGRSACRTPRRRRLGLGAGNLNINNNNNNECGGNDGAPSSFQGHVARDGTPRWPCFAWPSGSQERPRGSMKDFEFSGRGGPRASNATADSLGCRSLYLTVVPNKGRCTMCATHTQRIGYPWRWSPDDSL